MRKYTPHETYHLDGDEDHEDVALQLLTAEEKVEELACIVEHKEQEVDQLLAQLQ